MRRLISSGSLTEAAAAYSRAVVVDGWIFVSGTVGPDRDTGAFPPGAAAQAENAFKVIEAALAEAGASLADTVHCRVFVADRRHVADVVPVLKATFDGVMPANTTLIAQMPAEAALVEIELVARASGDR